MTQEERSRLIDQACAALQRVAESLDRRKVGCDGCGRDHYKNPPEFHAGEQLDATVERLGRVKDRLALSEEARPRHEAKEEVLHVTGARVPTVRGAR